MGGGANGNSLIKEPITCREIVGYAGDDSGITANTTIKYRICDSDDTLNLSHQNSIVIDSPSACISGNSEINYKYEKLVSKLFAISGLNDNSITRPLIKNTIQQQYGITESTGTANTFNGVYNAVVGSGNTIHGVGNVTIGTNNTVGHTDMSTPTNPEIGGDFTLTVGMNNIVDKYENFVIGRENTVSNRNNIVSGTNHSVSETGNLVVGQEHTITQGRNSSVVGYLNTINGSKVCGNLSVSGAGHVISSAVDSTISGNTNTLSSVANEIINGASNSITESENGSVCGQTNTITSSKNSIISGKSHTIRSVENELINGTSNSVTNSINGSVYGQNNTVLQSENSIVSGENHTIYNCNGSIHFGTQITTTDYTLNSIVGGTGYIVNYVNNSNILGSAHNTSNADIENSLLCGHLNTIESNLKAAIVTGQSNTIKGEDGCWCSIVGGTNNETNSPVSIIMGQYNSVMNNSYASVFGKDLTCQGNYQTVIGYVNKNSTSNIFEIGNGEIARMGDGSIIHYNPSNAFEVSNTGCAKAPSVDTTDGRSLINFEFWRTKHDWIEVMSAMRLPTGTNSINFDFSKYSKVAILVAYTDYLKLSGVYMANSCNYDFPGKVLIGTVTHTQGELNQYGNLFVCETGGPVVELPVATVDEKFNVGELVSHTFELGNMSCSVYCNYSAGTSGGTKSCGYKGMATRKFQLLVDCKNGTIKLSSKDISEPHNPTVGDFAGIPHELSYRDGFLNAVGDFTITIFGIQNA